MLLCSHIKDIDRFFLVNVYAIMNVTARSKFKLAHFKFMNNILLKCLIQNGRLIYHGIEYIRTNSHQRTHKIHCSCRKISSWISWKRNDNSEAWRILTRDLKATKKEKIHTRSYHKTVKHYKWIHIAYFKVSSFNSELSVEKRIKMSLKM